MYRLCSVLVEEFNRFAKLCSSDDRVVHEKKLLSVDKLAYRYLLHLCYLVSILLLCGGEATGPGRSVLDERTGKMYLALVCISDSVGRA